MAERNHSAKPSCSFSTAIQQQGIQMTRRVRIKERKTARQDGINILNVDQVVQKRRIRG